ncbi:hypothetical protein Hdeb2414_s0002g00048751 [Helianthus debilis subsp. tardiflorus]
MKLVLFLPTSPCANNLIPHAFQFSHHSSSKRQHSSFIFSSPHQKPPPSYYYSPNMTIIKSTSCLFLILLSFFIFMWYDNNLSGSWWLSIHMWSVIPVMVVVLVAGLVAVIMVRTTVVTWITVLVMLAIAGKRRRVLAVEGRKITGDVAMHLLKVLVKKRSLVAVACATYFSSVAMGWVA